MDDHQELSSRYIGNSTATSNSTQQLRYPMNTHPQNASTQYKSKCETLCEFEASWFEECEPTIPIPIRPTCNNLHELEFHSFEPSSGLSLLNMKGSWRSVWNVPEQAHPAASSDLFVILKRLHIQRDFDEEAYKIHQLDNMVMERLSSSPHIVSSFGFCGQSVLTEKAEKLGGSFGKNPRLSWKERLLIARDLARGLAELHALRRLDFELQDHNENDQKLTNHHHYKNQHNPDTNSLLVFAHYDINVGNLVSLSYPTWHWNDFNLGIVSRRRKTRTTTTTTTSSNRTQTAVESKDYCPVPIRYPGLLWRSPEEIQNVTGYLPQLQPSDVYSFGNVLFQCMSTQKPWSQLEDPILSLEQVAQFKVEGSRLPNFPTKDQPKRWEQQVLWLATQACYRQDPKQRPTAYQLAFALGTAYDWKALLQTKAETNNKNNTKMTEPSQQAMEELFLIPQG